MKQLSDLLREAKADAPPPRLDVDDLVAAGRRRVRRRNTEWAFTAVALVVALVLGVPRLLDRTDEPVLPATPSTSYYSFVLPFHGYSVGDYQISDPSTLRPGWATATIVRDGIRLGSLTLYPPGTELPDIYPETASATEPINGRPAFWQPNGSTIDSLAWEYTTGALAVIELPIGGNRELLRGLATKFVPGDGQPARLGFRVGYVPDGYRLVTVMNTREPDPAQSLAQLLPEAVAAELLTDPLRSLDTGVVKNVIAVRMTPVENVPSVGEQPKCTAEECSMLAGGGKYALEVTGKGVPAEELRQVFESVLQADPADPASWYPADEAFPASARLQPTK
ncbi:hypothetical protein AB0M02_36975 [Actinoplanes sp. NPDC051861]|uniref:hypothetical protein n=1 Tax=Actinoplanes sp. NPDC051861 TaxID=3155170 RepID=UPI003429196C